MDEQQNTTAIAEVVQPVCNQRMMSFGEAVTVCLRKYADFNGRATRAEYWWFFLSVAIYGSIIDLIFATTPGNGVMIAFILRLPFVLPLVAVIVRRLHDLGRSGWWMLLGFTLIGLLALWIYFCFPSQKWANKYGNIPCLTLKNKE